MDDRAFDSLAKSLSAAPSRRGLLAAALAALGLATEEDAGANPEDAGKRTGKGKGGRGGKEHGRNRGHGNGNGNGRNRKGKRCDPKPDDEVCAGKCGPRTNNCGKRAECRPCTCGEGCPECQACNPRTDLCADDASVDGTSCESGSGVCAGGSCCATEGNAAGANGCCAGLTECADGVCRADCCPPGQCGAGEDCAADGSCSCGGGPACEAGCCDGSAGCVAAGDCCAETGGRCEAGTCRTPRPSLAECGGRCNCPRCEGSVESKTVICELPVVCPDCAGCAGAGCADAVTLGAEAPDGRALYCVGPGIQGCSGEGSSCPQSSYCGISECRPICTGA